MQYLPGIQIYKKCRFIRTSALDSALIWITDLNWLPVRDRFEQCVNTHVFKQQNNSSPKYMNEVFTSAYKTRLRFRLSYKLKQPNHKKVSGYRTISYLGPNFGIGYLMILSQLQV